MVYKNILVPTNGSQATEDIIEFICSVQPITKTNITVIYVIEVPRNLPLNADMADCAAMARTVLDNAIRTAEKYSVTLNTSIIYARSADDAIITTAEDLKCDVIAIAQDRHKLGIFANTDTNIYQRAKCNVWLFNNKL